jgi:uncharacterized membrane protein (DUF4010 family)
VVLYGVYWAREWGGGAGLVMSGAVLGLTDVDALTISMARSSADAAAKTALLAGVLSNGVVKLGIAVAVGQGRYRRLAGGGLGVLAAASAVAVWVVARG